MVAAVVDKEMLVQIMVQVFLVDLVVVEMMVHGLVVEMLRIILEIHNKDFLVVPEMDQEEAAAVALVVLAVVLMAVALVVLVGISPGLPQTTEHLDLLLVDTLPVVVVEVMVALVVVLVVEEILKVVMELPIQVVEEDLDMMDQLVEAEQMVL